MPPDDVDPVPQSLVYLKIIPSQALSLPFVDEQALTDRSVFLLTLLSFSSGWSFVLSYV